MRNIMKQRVWLLTVTGLLSLFFTGGALAQTAASTWEVSISLDPSIVDLAQGTRETIVTVAVSHTEEAAPAALASLVICSVRSGEVVTVSHGLYPFGPNTIIWAGEVPTATPAIFTFTVQPMHWPETTVPCVLINEGLAQQTVTGTIDVVPYQTWLPLALRAYTAPIEPTGIHAWTYSAENWLMQSAGSNLAEAVTGNNLLAWRYDQAAITLNQAPSVSGQPYYLKRSFLTFDLKTLPAGKVISAWLELYTYNTWYGRFDLKFERGLWSRPPDTSDWNSYSETLGLYDTGQWTATALSLTLPLPGLIGQPRPATLNLTLRGDETTELPVGALESLRTHIALQWPDNPLQSLPQQPAGTPISQLHLIIEPEAVP
jgi:hypothetical protein